MNFKAKKGLNEGRGKVKARSDLALVSNINSILLVSHTLKMNATSEAEGIAYVFHGIMESLEAILVNLQKKQVAASGDEKDVLSNVHRKLASIAESFRLSGPRQAGDEEVPDAEKFVSEYRNLEKYLRSLINVLHIEGKVETKSNRDDGLLRQMKE